MPTTREDKDVALTEDYLNSFEDLRGLFLTRAEVRRRVGWTYRTINQRIQSNALATKTIGATVYISGDSIADLMSATQK